MAKTYEDYCREVIPEGIVLLENDGTLPLAPQEKVAIFGRGQFEYVKSGTGSGGRVKCKYCPNITEVLLKRVVVDPIVSNFFEKYIAENPFDNADNWLNPGSQKQPILPDEFVQAAAQRNDKAIFVICRVCGEGYDVQKIKGNWFLEDAEANTIKSLIKYFKNVCVLINSGNLIDMSWVKEYGVKCVAYVWQGGQEGAVGTADALMGDVSPSGKLTDTIATDITDYPCDGYFGDGQKNIHYEDIYVGYRYFETFAKEKVLYPFGFGLSYTIFSIKTLSAIYKGDTISLSVQVKNIGGVKGKEVVEVYFGAPQGNLGKPAKCLIDFKKTKLLFPEEIQTLDFSIPFFSFSCYDDCGKTSFPYSYVLEKGNYTIYVGNDVRTSEVALVFKIKEDVCVEKCVRALAPQESFSRLISKGGKLAVETVQPIDYSILERRIFNRPAAYSLTEDRGITLEDVKSGKAEMGAFIGQFSEKELVKIVMGEGMSSPKSVMPGTASSFCGTVKEFLLKGVPVITACDGPSGLRLECEAIATSIPSGILFASTWNTDCIRGIFGCFAEEMKKYQVDVILAPGINIHRYPLGGRNFEYFSEDPFLSGKFASAISETMYKNGSYCTLKHFAVNSQEYKRGEENEVVSERALREIYLKPFEIAVKSGYVKSIMTSYNCINGIHAATNYDLTNTILRHEWKYNGIVMTDWWTRLTDGRKGEENKLSFASMVGAGTDIYMVVYDCNTRENDIIQSLKDGYLSLGELQRATENLLKFSMEVYAYGKPRYTDFEESKNLQSIASALVVDNRANIFCKGEGLFICELKYKVNAEPLVQATCGILVNTTDATPSVNLIVAGTENESASIRFKLYLKKENILRFTGEAIPELIIVFNERE